MQIPNLLNMAMSVVGTQQFNLMPFESRYTNEIGVDVVAYQQTQVIQGQVQAVPRNLYEQYGLDFQRSHLTFYMSKDILDVTRDVSGDIIKYAGNTYQVLSKTDWFAINGWVGLVAVQITT